jgi:hypothetical protein
MPLSTDNTEARDSVDKTLLLMSDTALLVIS